MNMKMLPKRNCFLKWTLIRTIRRYEVKNDEPNVKNEDKKTASKWSHPIKSLHQTRNFFSFRSQLLYVSKPPTEILVCANGAAIDYQRRRRNKLARLRVYPEKQDRDHREATAIRITRLIIEIDMDKGLPNLGFNAYVFDRIKEHVHLRFKKCSQQDFSPY